MIIGIISVRLEWWSIGGSNPYSSPWEGDVLTSSTNEPCFVLCNQWTLWPQPKWLISHLARLHCLATKSHSLLESSCLPSHCSSWGSVANVLISKFTPTSRPNFWCIYLVNDCHIHRSQVHLVNYTFGIGGKNRTHINGFGDHCSTIKLLLHKCVVGNITLRNILTLRTTLTFTSYFTYISIGTISIYKCKSPEHS